MEETTVLEQVPVSEQIELAPVEAGYALNVAVVCQDAPTWSWADEVCNLAKQPLGDQPVRCSEWRLSDLDRIEVLAQAAQTAAQADVIVVCVRAVQELPPECYVWVDMWLPNRLQATGALVALVALPGRPGTSAEHPRDYLSAVARQAGLDFLLEERLLPAEPPVMAPGSVFLQVPAQTQPNYRRVADDAPGSYSRDWGINE